MVSALGRTQAGGTVLLFVLLLMVVPGSQLLIYPVLWILMPAEENVFPAAGASPYPTS